MKEMKENKELLAERIDEALKHLYDAKHILEDTSNGIKENCKEETPKKKLEIEINVRKPFGETIDLDDEELAQIRKDLEEIINDFTRE